MSIVRAKRERSFTTLNTTTFDLRIPPDELGVYLHLLSKPDDWSVNGVYLRNHFGMSKNKCYRILDALADRGLISKVTGRDDQGRITTEYTVYETTPQLGTEFTSPQFEDRSSLSGPVNEDVLNIESTTTTANSIQNWKPEQKTLDAIRLRGIPVEPGWIEEFRIWAENPDKQVTENNVESKFINWAKYERLNSAIIKHKMPVTPGAPLAHKEFVPPPEPEQIIDPVRAAENRKTLRDLISGGKRNTGTLPDDLDDRKREALNKLQELKT